MTTIANTTDYEVIKPLVAKYLLLKVQDGTIDKDNYKSKMSRIITEFMKESEVSMSRIKVLPVFHELDKRREFPSRIIDVLAVPAKEIAIIVMAFRIKVSIAEGRLA